MSELYRKSSLEKLASPEQLDRSVKVTSPLSWLALAGALVVVAAVVIWSMLGSLPTVSTASGVIISAENSYAVSSDSYGIVEELKFNVGDRVEAGSAVASIRNSVGDNIIVKSELSGIVSAQLIADEAEVLPGTELYRITPDAAGERVLICYVPYSQARGLEDGMRVAVYPSHIDNQSYGHMEAEILNVANYAADTNNMQLILGANNLVVEQIAAAGPVTAVLCKIKEDPSSENGFYWTNSKGNETSVPNGTFASAQIVISEDAPIKRLFQ